MSNIKKGLLLRVLAWMLPTKVAAAEVPKDEPETISMEDIRRHEALSWLNTPAIFISNEWDDPVIGFVTEVNTRGRGDAITTMHDYVRNQPRAFIGPPQFGFSYTRLATILKLNPYERAALTFKHFDISPNKPKSGTASTPMELLKKLYHNGFFTRVNEYASELLDEDGRKQTVEDLKRRLDTVWIEQVYLAKVEEYALNYQYLRNDPPSTLAVRYDGTYLDGENLDSKLAAARLAQEAY